MWPVTWRYRYRYNSFVVRFVLIHSYITDTWNCYNLPLFIFVVIIIYYVFRLPKWFWYSDIMTVDGWRQFKSNIWYFFRFNDSTMNFYELIYLIMILLMIMIIADSWWFDLVDSLISRLHFTSLRFHGYSNLLTWTAWSWSTLLWPLLRSTFGLPMGTCPRMGMEMENVAKVKVKVMMMMLKVKVRPRKGKAPAREKDPREKVEKVAAKAKVEERRRWCGTIRAQCSMASSSQGTHWPSEWQYVTGWFTSHGRCWRWDRWRWFQAGSHGGRHVHRPFCRTLRRTAARCRSSGAVVGWDGIVLSPGGGLWVWERSDWKHSTSQESFRIHGSTGDVFLLLRIPGICMEENFDLVREDIETMDSCSACTSRLDPECLYRNEVRVQQQRR